MLGVYIQGCHLTARAGEWMKPAVVGHGNSVVPIISIYYCLLASFPRIGPFILTRLFQPYCLSLYGSALWTLSCPALRLIEVTFNRVLRRIWRLPSRSHTGIVHLVANLDSLFNFVFRRSNSLRYAAAKCPSVLVQSVFLQSTSILVILTLDTTLCLVRII